MQRQLHRTGLASYEPATAAALLTLFEAAGPGFVFYDVGANIGLYSSMAVALFEPAAVVAFEPMPHIADIAGTADLHISPLADTSNSLDPDFRDGDEVVRVPLVRTRDPTPSVDRRDPRLAVHPGTHHCRLRSD